MEKLRMMAEQKKANILNTGVDPNGNPVPQITVDMTDVNTAPTLDEAQYMSFRNAPTAETYFNKAKELSPSARASWMKNFKFGNPQGKKGV